MVLLENKKNKLYERGKVKLVTTMLIMLLLAACGSPSNTYMEQYDLGMRYLSEGNYEKAVLAFTAAIEIDDKKPDAYIGRGDAYTASEKYDLAEMDYRTVLDIDETNADAYIKLSELYLAKDDEKAAIRILQDGYERTEDEKIQKQLKKMGLYYVKDVTAQFIFDSKIYQKEYEEFWSSPGYRQCASYGIRFFPAISVEYNNKAEHVREAGLYNDILPLSYSEETGIELDNDEEDIYWKYFDTNVYVSGYFTYNGNNESLYYDEDGILTLNPNGPHDFHLLDYRFENEVLN